MTFDHNALLMTSALRAIPLPAYAKLVLRISSCEDAVSSTRSCFIEAIALLAFLAERGYALVNFYAFAST